MVVNLFENFLDDPLQYEQSEKLWQDLWSGIPQANRERFLWQTPWMGTGSLSIKDGNPIFSAYSPLLRRGIRIIQQEPVEPGLDFQVWLDTFGGVPMEPESVNELVIACVLSDVATVYALTLMTPWVVGRPITFERDEGGQLVLNRSSRAVPDFPQGIYRAA